MAQRLQLINEAITAKNKFVDSSFDFLGFESLLTTEQNVPLSLFRNSGKK